MSRLLDPALLTTATGEQWLVDRAVKGDEEAFRTLYETYYNKTFAICKGILLNSEEAEDIVQEVFLLAHKNLRRFDRRAKFSTWLFRIAVNRSIQESRKSKYKAQTYTLTDEVTDTVAGPEEPSTVDPAIESAMSRLHEADRAVLTLFYWDELSLEDIGATLGCSSNAAKTRLFRARERFREAYEGALS
ncbi:MAG: sigma-70 family RNA polymerase sigma factor [Chthonomonadaceae bacterium]|nr:sigma-70 family RNA polymerase sigma factor [Chthonomonadaceae bacterium]